MAELVVVDLAIAYIVRVSANSEQRRERRYRRRHQSRVSGKVSQTKRPADLRASAQR